MPSVKKQRGREYSPEMVKKLKKEFLKKYEETKGMLRHSCRACQISSATIYKWQDEDQDFCDAMDDIRKRVDESVEGRLMELIERGNPSAVYFYLKCRMGYRETARLEVENKDNVNVKDELAKIKEALDKKKQ